MTVPDFLGAMFFAWEFAGAVALVAVIYVAVRELFKLVFPHKIDFEDEAEK
jgi:hypothetical protein